jgi:hypothetical protein
MPTKYCSHCHRLRKLTAFSHHRGRWDGRQNWCKACMSRDRRRRYAQERGYLWVEEAQRARGWPPAARG